MIFGIQVETYKNLKNRTILHIRKSDQYFFLSQRNEQMTYLLKSAFVYGLSVPLVISIFADLPIYVYVIIGVVFYSFLVGYYNTKVLPMLPPARGKDRQRNTAADKKQSSRSMMIRGVLLAVIGIALLICLALGMAEGELKIIAACGAVVAFLAGMQNIYHGVKE
jgi:hypothetical protein